MKPFELLTENDKKLIVNYIKAFGSSDSEELKKMAPLEEILWEWDCQNSKQLLKMLNNQLILEFPVEFEKSANQLMDDFYDAYKKYPILSNFNTAWDTSLAPYFEEEEKYIIFGKEYKTKTPSELFWKISKLINPTNLIDNCCPETFDIPTPDGKVIHAKQGMKVMRLLSKIANAFNIPNFEDFRIAHSMVLNDRKLNGELCISIHPMDFMTMSDNNCHWTSCMSWMEPGDYRSGTVEMMNSPCVVIAYLKSADNMTYYYGSSVNEWNSKKWRSLFVIDKDVIFNVKNYPYENKTLTEKCLFILKELAEKNLGYSYDNKTFVFDSFNAFEYNNITRKIHPSTDYMYNDCGSQQIGILNPNPEESKLYINYSGPFTCMWCGYRGDAGSDSVVCYDCCNEYRCCCCDTRLSEDYYYEWEGEIYCEDCYYDMFEVDALTEENIHNTDTVYLYLVDKTPENEEVWLNQHCSILTSDYSIDNPKVWDTYFSSPVLKHRGNWGRTYRYITIDACNKDALNLFGFNSSEEAYEYFKKQI